MSDLSSAVKNAIGGSNTGTIRLMTGDRTKLARRCRSSAAASGSWRLIQRRYSAGGVDSLKWRALGGGPFRAVRAESGHFASLAADFKAVAGERPAPRVDREQPVGEFLHQRGEPVSPRRLHRGEFGLLALEQFGAAGQRRLELPHAAEGVRQVPAAVAVHCCHQNAGTEPLPYNKRLGTRSAMPHAPRRKRPNRKSSRRAKGSVP